MEIKEIYRLTYGVDTKNPFCRACRYAVVDEKNKYYVIYNGYQNKHIKKEDIGVIHNIDTDRTHFYVYLTDLSEKDRYIGQMMDKIQTAANERIIKFTKIKQNVIPTVCEIEDVTAEERKISRCISLGNMPPV